jgi:hypothetical protein
MTHRSRCHHSGFQGIIGIKGRADGAERPTKHGHISPLVISDPFCPLPDRREVPGCRQCCRKAGRPAAILPVVRSHPHRLPRLPSSSCLGERERAVNPPRAGPGLRILPPCLDRDVYPAWCRYQSLHENCNIVAREPLHDNLPRRFRQPSLDPHWNGLHGFFPDPATRCPFRR